MDAFRPFETRRASIRKLKREGQRRGRRDAARQGLCKHRRCDDRGVDPGAVAIAASAMTDLTLPLEGLSSVNGKSVIARFDGGTLSSDSGVIALGEVEKRLGVAGHPQELDDFDRALTGWDGESGVSLRGVGDGCFDA